MITSKELMKEGYEEYKGFLLQVKEEINTSKIDDIIENFKIAVENNDQELFNKCENSYFVIRDFYAYAFEEFNEDEEQYI